MSKQEEVERLIRCAMQEEMGNDGPDRVTNRIKTAEKYAIAIMAELQPNTPRSRMYTYVVVNTEANAGYDEEIVKSIRASSYTEALTLAKSKGYSINSFPYILKEV